MPGRPLIRSTTARFVLLAFVLQFVVTGGVLAFVLQASQRALSAEQRELVGELRSELTAAWTSGGEDGLRSLIRKRLEISPGSLSVILYARADGSPIAGNLDAWPTVIAPQSTWRTIDLYRVGGGRPEHMGITAQRLPDGSRLLTGQVIESSLRLERVNEEAVIAALAAGSALMLLAALVIGRALSHRIETIALTASAVSNGALGARVPLDGSGDAFDHLAHSVNAMLERIEDLISQLRMITDGLAHDLRSPVTRMKVLIERAVIETSDPDAVATLDRIAQEAETLLRMLSTALQISRAEAGIGRERFTTLDIAALLEDIVEIYGPLAEDSGFTLEAACPPGVTAVAHRELLSQAIGNLIENALKYARGGDSIVLSARPEQDALWLSVADNGIGIAPDQRAEALRRFSRLDPARQVSGSGLGLSLVEAVAKLHRGTIELGDNAPGLRVDMRIAPA